MIGCLSDHINFGWIIRLRKIHTIRVDRIYTLRVIFLPSQTNREKYMAELKDIEGMIRQAAALRGTGPYASQDAINLFRKHMREGQIPFHSYLAAINSLDLSVARIDASKPDTSPRTWRSSQR